MSSSEGSGKQAQMRRLSRAFIARTLSTQNMEVEKGSVQILSLAPLDTSTWVFNPFNSGYQLTGTLANSEDQDEMLLNVTFHQGLHCLLR